MQRTRLAGVALGLIASWAAAAEPPGGEWITFAPAGGRFRVEIPGEPLPESESHFTPVGSVEERKWWLATGGVELAVETHDVPALGVAVTPEHVILDRSRDGVIASKGGRAIESRELVVQGAPAREFRYAVPASQGRRAHVGWARTILVGRRVYLLTGTASEAPEAHPDVQRFFSSFRFWE